jgi:menaquinone-dependent protoporphyrinogen oxidase
MSLLVAYASKHGATQAIAERIAEKLSAAGQAAEARSVKAAGDLAKYDAFVIGSAAYLGSWLTEAVEFVRQNEAILSARPVWLFSSGPLGTQATDAQGRDLLLTSEPKQFAELRQAIKPRATQVFFGTLDPATLGISERLMRRMPAGRALLPEGDFRDWAAIEAWAEGIARELAAVRTG